MACALNSMLNETTQTTSTLLSHVSNRHCQLCACVTNTTYGVTVLHTLPTNPTGKRFHLYLHLIHANTTFQLTLKSSKSNQISSLSGRLGFIDFIQSAWTYSNSIHWLACTGNHLAGNHHLTG